MYGTRNADLPQVSPQGRAAGALQEGPGTCCVGMILPLGIILKKERRFHQTPSIYPNRPAHAHCPCECPSPFMPFPSTAKCLHPLQLPSLPISQNSN